MSGPCGPNGLSQGCLDSSHRAVWTALPRGPSRPEASVLMSRNVLIVAPARLLLLLYVNEIFRLLFLLRRLRVAWLHEVRTSLLWNAGRERVERRSRGK